MSEPEIIRLRKEIRRLKELNEKLNQDNESLNNEIGQLQLEKLSKRNQQEVLNQTSLIVENKEKMRAYIENLLETEREKLEAVEKKNNELEDNLKIYEKKLKANEIYIQKIQQENNDLKRNLIVFEKKHEGKDIIDNQRNRDDAIQKKEKDYQKLVFEWNELRDKMEEVLNENRILRQMADVPENFGIDIEKIKMGDRIKIEDYKSKIRVLQKNIDELETERAQLKRRLIFLNNSLQNNEPPFSLLSKEQKVEVAKYAEDLFEGREFIKPERYQLIKENEELKNKIASLENELSVFKLGGRGFINKKGDNDNLEEMIKTVVKETTNDMIKSNQLKLDNNDNDNIKLKAGNKKIIDSIKNEIDENKNKEESIISLIKYPPPQPINKIGTNEFDKGTSFIFNSTYKIPNDKLYEIFGVAINDEDVDALKKESACLQIQIIELLEIENRRNNNDRILNNNLKGIYNKLENLVLIQNEIFNRYMIEKKKKIEDYDNLKKRVEDLQEEINSNKRIINSYEENIKTIERGNLNEIERRMIENVKDNAILETNYFKLQRKYQCLFDEEKKQREFIENNELNQIEKDKKLKELITKLKEWKSLLIFYLRFLNKKLRNSVDKNDYDRIFEQNKYLRQRANELYKRDNILTKEMIASKSLLIKYRDLENSFYLCEEDKLDSQIECGFLRKKLQECDPNYYNEQKSFRKLIYKLQSLGLSFNQIKKSFIISKPNLEQSHDSNNNENKQNILGQSYSFLQGLTMDNAYITKYDFENCLLRLGISERDINKTDLQFIYSVLNCENDDLVDIRFFLKKLEQYSTESNLDKIPDELLFDKFIQCVKNSSQSLLSVFQYFDTNNNGNITREEFKFALKQLKFEVGDEEIDKLIILVSGKSEFEFKLDDTDTFNYIEFCDLFEQKAKNYLLKSKRIINNKNSIQIDWKFNQLSNIIEAIDKNSNSIDNAFYGQDLTRRGYITYNEFENVIHSLNVQMSNEDCKKLFDLFDTSQSNIIPLDKLISSLKITEKEIENYKLMTNAVLTDTAKKIDYAKKFTLLNEEKQYFNIKMNQMVKRLEELENMNSDLTKNLENYSKKNQEFANKYFITLEELQQYKEVYVNIGVKKSDLEQIKFENDSLLREVTILRIGLNTFKELYNYSNIQIRSITMNKEKNKDELNTYKKAIKELQSENNQNALIGKLYYTILISRWREANTLRKYDDFIIDFNSLKEENFQLETQYKNLTKDLTDIQVTLRDKIIENTRMIDELENYENGIIAYTSDKNEIHPIDEMKSLIEMLSEDKKEMTENIIKLKKNVLSLENQNDTLKNKIDFCENLVNNIKFNNRDEFSKKLISMSEEISTLKLNNNVLKRENKSGKENEKYLQKLNDKLTNDIKNYEKENVEWEKKYRKMQEIYKTKDDARQKKIINSLENMKLYDQNKLKTLFNEKSPRKTNSLKNKINDENSIDEKNQYIPNEEYEKKINQLNNIIKLKNDEIEKLSKINKDNAELIKEGENFYKNNSVSNLVGEDGYNIIRDDETKKIAKTAHKTIKTLQDIITQKNNIIKRKENQIENLYQELQKVKESDLRRINDLEDLIRDNDERTMKKLQKLIDKNNPNIMIRQSKNNLSLLTLDELEKLLFDKDSTIKSLQLELKTTKDENDSNYAKLGELNRKIAELEQNLKYKDINNQNNLNNEIFENLRKQLDEKNKLIEEEREKIDRIKNEFAKLYQDKKLAEDEVKLDNTVFVPEKNIVNNEKSELYVKINNLRKMNKKLNDELKKLENILKEKEIQLKELNTKYEKEKENGKEILKSQYKDTKRISQLKKEKEKLEKNNDKLRDEIDKLKSKIIELEEENRKNSQSNLRNRQQRTINREMDNNSINNNSQNLRISDNNINNSNLNEINTNLNERNFENSNLRSQNFNYNIPSINNKEISSNLDQEDLINRLIYFCLNKNIVLSKEFEKYDLATDNKIIVKDFKYAIVQLNPGFIEPELNELIKISKPDINNNIKYKDFIQLMTEKNENYKALEEKMKDKDNIDRPLTKKYNPFENKSFNINY